MYGEIANFHLKDAMPLRVERVEVILYDKGQGANKRKINF
jgi:hypothetical protein